MASSNLTTKSGFNTLPDELQLRIIELARLLPAPSPSPSPPTTAAALPSIDPPLDRATAFTLLTVSKDVHKLALPVLYRSATISRPSALESFFRTISERPDLGKLVRTLRIHDVGARTEWCFPLEKRGADWSFPLSKHGAPTPSSWTIVCSLFSAEETKLLPSNIKPSDQWPLHSAAGSDKRSQAIHTALLVIQRCLGMDVKKVDIGPFINLDARVSSPEWVVLMHEAQAALDLYLMAMRRCEDAAPGGKGYPQLCITGYPGSSIEELEVNDGHYVLDCKDLLDHLARPRAPNDRFDHPLLYARSGIDVWSNEFHQPQKQEDADFAAGLDTTFWSRTASTERIKSLLLDVLGLTPQLEALTVMEYLEEAVCRSTVLLPEGLRYLSLEPCSWLWYKPLSLASLHGIEQLCIRGMPTRELDITDVCIQVSDQLKTLTLDWTPPKGTLSSHTIECLKRKIDSFVGGGDTAGTGQIGASEVEPPPREEGHARDSKDSSAKQGSPLTIEFRLHPKDLKCLLDQTTQAEGRAWAVGPLVGHRRCPVLLLDSQGLDSSRSWGV